MLCFNIKHVKTCLQGKLLSFYNVTVEGDRYGTAGRKFGVCVRSSATLPSSHGSLESFYGANMAVVLLPYTTDPDDVSYQILFNT